MLGVVAAFGIAPSTTTNDVTQSTVREYLSPETTPHAHEVGNLLTLYREERVQRGDTFGSVLTRLGVNDPESVAKIHTDAIRLGALQLRTGRTVRAALLLDGSLVNLWYLTHDGGEVTASRYPNGSLELRYALPNPQITLEMNSGRIRSSLFQATDDAGLDDDIAVQLAEIFSGEIDFHRDLQSGDRFSVVYESVHVGNERLRSGKVVAAEFRNGAQRYRAFLHRDAVGRESYYTEDGKNLRKSLLRSPLEFSRITSGFSRARFHPVLETWRAHRGVDYGAPIGTRVRATGDGYVKFAGQMRGYGNVVVIRHPNGYETLYGHLSAFGPGLRTGIRVRQSDIVGFVGMTGLTTGPHLHYELRIDGVHRDPLKVVAPPATGLASVQLDGFKASVQPLIARLDLIEGIDLSLRY